jgi:hypothetical protein
MSGVMNEDLVKEREDLDWLEARERGDAELPPIDPERAGRYQRMQATLAELPELSAPDGWEGAIYDELDRMEAEERGEAAPKIRSSVKVMLADDSDGLGAEEDEPGETPSGDLPRAAGSGLQKVNPAAVDQLAKVRELSASQKRSRSGARWPLGLAVASSLAAVALGALWISRERASPEGGEESDPSLQIAAGPQLDFLEGPGSGGTRRSGDSARLTRDSVKVSFTATTTGELRLYREDSQVVARCPGDLSCIITPLGEQRRFSLEVELKIAGNYRAVFLPGSAVAEPSGKLDADLERCDCEFRVAAPFEVE